MVRSKPYFELFIFFLMLGMNFHFISINILLYTLMHCLFFQTANAHCNTSKENYNQQIDLLLSRLNLNAEGLEKAKKYMNDRELKYALRPIEAEYLAFMAITFLEYQLSDSWENEAFSLLNNEIGIKAWD